MNIDELEVGMKVMADVGENDPDVFEITEIIYDLNNPAVNLSNSTLAMEDVLIDDIRPLPEMPEKVFIDTPGFMRMSVCGNDKQNDTPCWEQFFSNSWEDKRYFHIQTDGMADCDVELTRDQIAVVERMILENS